MPKIKILIRKNTWNLKSERKGNKVIVGTGLCRAFKCQETSINQCIFWKYIRVPFQSGFSQNSRKPKQKMNKHMKKKHVRRGKGRKQYNLIMFSNNVAGLTSASKTYCLKSEIRQTNASIFTIQETCLKRKGKFQIKGYEIFEAIRNKDKRTKQKQQDFLSFWL